MSKYEGIADQYLNIKIQGTDEFMTECPWCSGKSSLQFNINSGLWICFKCGEKGSAKTLVRRLGGAYADPAVSAENIRAHIDRIRTRKKEIEERNIEKALDENFLARYDFDSDYWSDGRRLSSDTIREFQLGYDPILDRHTIPYRNSHGDLLGVIQRRTTDEPPRYIYPQNFNKRESLFGSWLLGSTRKVALVEGSTDVLSLYEAGIVSVAQYGSSISREQARMLHRLNVKEVVLFYDYDEAGRKAEEQSRRYIEGILIRRVNYDENKYCWHKKLCNCGEHNWKNIGKCSKRVLCRCGRKHDADPGSLKQSEIRKMFRNAELVGTIKEKKKWFKQKTA